MFAEKFTFGKNILGKQYPQSCLTDVRPLPSYRLCTATQILKSATYKRYNVMTCDNITPENVKLKIHKPVFVPVVLYWSETLSHALSEEHRRKVFEN